MRKRGRPPTLSLEGDITRIGIDISPKTKERVVSRANELRTTISEYMRGLIGRDLSSNHTLEILEKTEAETKLTLENIQKKITEEKIKIQKKKDEENEKQEKIEKAHGDLLEALIRGLWNPLYISHSTFRTYAEYTGESIETLKAWVEEQAEKRDEIEMKRWKEKEEKNPKKIKKEEKIQTKDELIEEAHEKLTEALERYNWQPERIQKATYKVYADFTGESVENLEAWVKEKAKTKGD